MEISILCEDSPNLSTMFIKQKYRVIDYRNFCIAYLKYRAMKRL